MQGTPERPASPPGGIEQPHERPGLDRCLIPGPATSGAGMGGDEAASCAPERLWWGEKSVRAPLLAWTSSWASLLPAVLSGLSGLQEGGPCPVAAAHPPTPPQRHPQQVHLHLPLLRRPQPGPAGAGEALCGQPSQRPQPRGEPAPHAAAESRRLPGPGAPPRIPHLHLVPGVPRLLGHALGRPWLQERQLPAAPAPPPQVLLRHLRGGCPGGLPAGQGCLWQWPGPW